MTQHKKFMQEALRLAKKNISIVNGGPFGAVVIHKGKIIGSGSNEVTARNDPTAHAEIIAIREACLKMGTWHLEECEIYASCEPCPMCLSAIYWAKIKKVYFAATRYDAASLGFNDEFIYNEIQLPHNHRTLPMEQMMEKEAKEIFRKWSESEHKILY